MMRKEEVVVGDVNVVLDELQKNSFDLAIVDPPYNIGKDFGNNKTNMSVEEYIDWSKRYIDKIINCIKEDGVVYIYGVMETLARIASLYPIEKQKILIWHYTNRTSPTSKFWQKSYEGILCLWKSKGKPRIYIDQIREKYGDKYKNFSGKIRKNTTGRFGSKSTIYKVNKLGALPRDVLKIPTLAGGNGTELVSLCKTCDTIFFNKQKNEHIGHCIIKHHTQKPQHLTEKLIKSTVEKNHKANILIPFSGSGSECVVVKRMGLNFTAIELNPDYVYLSKKWLSYHD